MKYRITCDVLSVEGWQEWTVDAASEAEALEKHRAGQSQFEHEELDVMSIGEPEVKPA